MDRADSDPDDPARTFLPGEELTYDYRLSLDNPLTRKELAQYICRCGATKCRGSLLHGE